MKGVVKILKEGAIKKWSKGRCLGKIKGYNKRIKEVAAAMLLLNDLGKLSDDILRDLYVVVMVLHLNKHNLYMQTQGYPYTNHFTRWDTVFLYRFSWVLGNKEIYNRLEVFVKEFRTC
jgi:hypothetical protein